MFKGHNYVVSRQFQNHGSAEPWYDTRYFLNSDVLKPIMKPDDNVSKPIIKPDENYIFGFRY